MIEDGAIGRNLRAARSGARHQGGLARFDLQVNSSSRSTTAAGRRRCRSRPSSSRWRWQIRMRARFGSTEVTADVLEQVGSTSWKASRASRWSSRPGDRLGDQEGADRELHGAQGARLGVIRRCRCSTFQYHDTFARTRACTIFSSVRARVERIVTDEEIQLRRPQPRRRTPAPTSAAKCLRRLRPARSSA